MATLLVGVSHVHGVLAAATAFRAVLSDFNFAMPLVFRNPFGILAPLGGTGLPLPVSSRILPGPAPQQSPDTFGPVREEGVKVWLCQLTRNDSFSFFLPLSFFLGGESSNSIISALATCRCPIAPD